VPAHQLAQHVQCRPQLLFDGRGVEIEQQRGDRFPVATKEKTEMEQSA
jgi:hypothetical protein